MQVFLVCPARTVIIQFRKITACDERIMKYFAKLLQSNGHSIWDITRVGWSNQF